MFKEWGRGKARRHVREFGQQGNKPKREPRSAVKSTPLNKRQKAIEWARGLREACPSGGNR